MIKIAICDDEALYCERVVDLCRQYFQQEMMGSKVEYSFMVYSSGEELLAGDVPDILLLDIEMPQISGIQVKELLQKRRAKTRILYITSHPESMREAFGFQVFGFLEKPLKYKEFCRKMDVAVRDILASEREVCYQELDVPKRVKLSEIRYINASGRYSYLFLEGETEGKFTDHSLGWWEKELTGEHFVRCHYGYLVNCAFIRKYKGDKVVLKTGKEIPMSRRRMTDVRDAYFTYVRDSAR